MASPPTTARLRHDIDRGRGGDKVDVGDPATAPLGTDDEAAGTPPAGEAIQQAHVQEIGSAPRSSERTPEIGVVLVFCAIVLALAAATFDMNSGSVLIYRFGKRRALGVGSSWLRPTPLVLVCGAERALPALRER